MENEPPLTVFAEAIAASRPGTAFPEMGGQTGASPESKTIPTDATGRGELRWRGRIEPFRSTEIADYEKPRIIEAYVALGLPGAVLLMRPITRCSGSSDRD
jgi:hypothetical protein